MQRYGAQAADLGWVIVTPFLALLIRDNFVIYSPHWQALIAYAAISCGIFALAFLVTGIHKTLWQHTSLPDVLRIIGVVTVALLLAVCISFVESRLEGVARSIPVIQWFLLISAQIGSRVAFLLWRVHARRGDLGVKAGPRHSVLVVGAGPLTELYLRSVTEYGSKTVGVVGILSDDDIRGRRLRHIEVMGTPEELRQVIDRLEVHGVIVERVVVAQPLKKLSNPAAQVLLELERDTAVKVDWIVELLGLTPEDTSDHNSAVSSPGHTTEIPPRRASPLGTSSLGRSDYVKRCFDVGAALFLGVILAPLILVTALIVCLDVGVPLVFWQQRPGRFGHPFKLFKFRTMCPGHDALGNRVRDEQRTSSIGAFLRKTRLDELPQLYNILVGDMSFVGPRPLLAADQPGDMDLRLSVRPGMTGLAQVNGGRNMSAEDKSTLDNWYVRHVSLWLDLKIMLLTAAVVMGRERVDHDKVRVARDTLTRLQTQTAGKMVSHSLVS